MSAGQPDADLAERPTLRRGNKLERRTIWQQESLRSLFAWPSNRMDSIWQPVDRVARFLSCNFRRLTSCARVSATRSSRQQPPNGLRATKFGQAKVAFALAASATRQPRQSAAELISGALVDWPPSPLPVTTSQLSGAQKASSKCVCVCVCVASQLISEDRFCFRLRKSLARLLA